MDALKKTVSCSRFLLLSVLPAFTCACLLVGDPLAQKNGIVNGDVGKRLDEHFTSIAASDFSGVVLVVKNGETLLSKGYGAANRKKRIPFTDKTAFEITSITKQFTAAAILKLEMQGKLRTTDTIDKYFANLRHDKSAITIHHLLTHSAGFANNLGQDDFAPLGRNEFIELAVNSTLKFRPGEGFNYSNIGYGLLGAIIEIVSGQSYERYLHDNLFAPAGMSKTGHRIPQWNPDEVAIGYYKFGFEWGSPLEKPWDADGPFWNMRASSGMLSTADDLHKWHLALHGEKILSNEAKEKFFTPFMPADRYGYGWVFSRTPRNTTIVWHDGSNKIFNAYFRRYVDEGVVVVIATNFAQHQAEMEIAKLDELVFGKN
jgi:CubicO group peptidase (beta-lactamase class C family)